MIGWAARGGEQAGAGYTSDELVLVIEFSRRSHPVIHNQIAAARQGGGATGDISAPLGETAAGRLVFSAGVNRVSIGAGAGPDQLYHAHFEGTVPEIRVQDGTVTGRYRRFGPF